MIINKRTNYIIEEPEEVLKAPKHVHMNLDSSEYIFVVPKEITDNAHKVIYKVGFLATFYYILNQDMKKAEIFKKINNEWQVFIGHRQMERHCKKYIELFEKKKRN